MASRKTEVNVADVMKRYAIIVNAKGARKARIRFQIGLKLIRWGSRIAGLGPMELLVDVTPRDGAPEP